MEREQAQESVGFRMNWLRQRDFHAMTIITAVLASRISHPNIVSRTPDPEHRNRRFTSNNLTNQDCPQLKIIRIDDSVFFGSVNDIEAALHHIGNHTL